ncbi:D-alanine--D-alanine ligase family protein [Mesorhizobium australafricanum]|uniref:ATP-grasp domain-containing protein n=1 Tax=Mesorhizobium australafricanum TaxID=3072311 RepID=A0ABU4X407_9HYPH|nr:ATP-grasp domain-containing protein [Mesorhizobium sp. VK3E]MDX8443055.1 ATP-grasp domain-containing protein [Mesorhizobium sp. VK3E]
MRIAIVRNDENTGVINRFGQPCPEKFARDTGKSVAAALQEGGHETLLCEGDKRLLATLERFLPPQSRARPSGIVFNLAYGIQGESRLTHVPAMLEMAGVPYTGSGPLGHGLALDKVITKRLIRDRGMPTPNFRVMRPGTQDTGDMQFPLIVKPRHESDSCGLQLVHEPAQLKQAVEMIVTQYAQDALVEEYIEGREICVALLGNGDLEVLPMVEQDFGDCDTRLVTWEAKHMAVAPPPKICPAQIGRGLATALRDISVATFRACQCRDYVRIDYRIDPSGQPLVLEINTMPGFDTGSAYGLAAVTAGYSFSGLVNRILDAAHTRYFGFAFH